MPENTLYFYPKFVKGYTSGKLLITLYHRIQKYQSENQGDIMKSACFTGHRNLSCDIEDLKSRLYNALERMIKNAGIVEFYNGGAIGWDTLTAQTVLELRQKYPHIRLNMVLPCSPENQSYKWTPKQKKTYFYILEQADSIEQISERYFDGCMKKRNARLIELSDCCFCYWNGNMKSGTVQTIRMAQRKHIMIVNFCHK